MADPEALPENAKGQPLNLPGGEEPIVQILRSLNAIITYGKQVRQDLELARTVITNMLADIDALETSVGNLQTGGVALTTRVTNLETAGTALTGRVTTLETKATQAQNKFAQIEARLDALEALLP